jgi:hypothetical protein
VNLRGPTLSCDVRGSRQGGSAPRACRRDNRCEICLATQGLKVHGIATDALTN